MIKKANAEKIRHTKKTYSKPVIRVVELAAAEVLAEGCKQRLSGTAFGATPCAANNCAKKTNS